MIYTIGCSLRDKIKFSRVNDFYHLLQACTSSLYFDCEKGFVVTYLTFLVRIGENRRQTNQKRQFTVLKDGKGKIMIVLCCVLNCSNR